MNDQDREAAIRQRRAAMPAGPLDVEVDRTEEEYYMRWATVQLRTPDEDGWHEVIARTHANDRDRAEFIAHAPADVDWLLDRHEQDRAEVERLHGNVMRLQDKHRLAFEGEIAARAEVERLRGLLRRLEWSGQATSGERIGTHPRCPVCRVTALPHDRGCWLAEVI